MQFEKVEDDSLLYDGGEAVPHHECDSPDRCCKIVPLRCGVTLLGVFCVINGAMMALNGITALTGSVIWGCMCFVMVAGPIYAAYKWKAWYADQDNKDLRETLPRAFLVQFIAYILANIFSIFGCRTDGIIMDIIDIIVMSCLTIYYYKVLKRFVVYDK